MKRTGIVTIEFFKGQSGQTSIELLLVVGALFLIVISTLPYIGDANKVNKGVAAARDGATFAQTMLNLGYSYTTEWGDVVELPQGETVHVDDITYTTSVIDMGGGNTQKFVEITLTISGTSDLLTAIQISEHSLNYIYYAFNGEWSNESVAWVVTGGHRFEVYPNCLECP